jgi:hypothetical protein
MVKFTSSGDIGAALSPIILCTPAYATPEVFGDLLSG